MANPTMPRIIFLTTFIVVLLSFTITFAALCYMENIYI